MCVARVAFVSLETKLNTFLRFSIYKPKEPILSNLKLVTYWINLSLNSASTVHDTLKYAFLDTILRVSSKLQKACEVQFGPPLLLL